MISKRFFFSIGRTVYIFIPPLLLTRTAHLGVFVHPAALKVSGRMHTGDGLVETAQAV